MYDMIKKANKARAEIQSMNENVLTNLKTLAESSKQTSQVLAESVTSVLANIASTAQQGGELKLMHLNSIAAFLAGVETLAQRLPNSQDANKTANTLRVLSAVGIGPDGNVTYATTPVAQLGARNEQLLQKYQKLVNDYAQSQSRGEPNGQQLTQATRQLQVAIDRAMRQASGSGGQQAGSQARGETSFSANKAAAQPAVM